MISPYAVEDYLTRPLRDLLKWKKYSRKKINRIYKRYGGPLKIGDVKPAHHQKVSYILGCKHHRFLHLLDCGAGKTLTLMMLMKRHRAKYNRALVLVPSIANVGAWADENDKWKLVKSMAGVTGTPTQRRRAVWGPSDATVMTYMGLLRFTCKTVRKGKKSKLIPDIKMIDKFVKEYDFVVGDEITAAQNGHSISSRVLYLISKRVKFFYGLTGTPFGRKVEAIFSQFLVVDLGETFGTSIGLFREAFFTATPRYWGGFDYKLRKRTLPILKKWMRNRSVRYRDSEFTDLPPLVESVRKASFGRSVEEQYNKLAEEHFNAKKNRKLAEASFIRMRQMTGGFVVLKGHNEVQMEIELKQNPKMEMLMELLEEIPTDAKIIVFNQFKKTGAMIEAALKKAKIECVRLYSGTKNKQNVAKEFNNSKTARVLICSSTGAYGINVQGASYAIFYESPVDSRERYQMIKRLHRKGQTKTVFSYDLLIRDSVDERVLNFIKQGKNLLKSIVDGESIDFRIKKKAA